MKTTICQIADRQLREPGSSEHLKEFSCRLLESTLDLRQRPLACLSFEWCLKVRAGNLSPLKWPEGEDADGALSAIERAKALLVQTATFEMPVDGNDVSDGSKERVHTAESNFYTFEYRDGDQVRQVAPAEMPSFEAARAEAIRCAIEMVVDLQPGADDLTGWLIRVRDHAGNELCSIDVAEAEAARQANVNTPL